MSHTRATAAVLLNLVKTAKHVLYQSPRQSIEQLTTEKIMKSLSQTVVLYAMSMGFLAFTVDSARAIADTSNPHRVIYEQNQKSDKHFKREEEFPDGKQTTWAGGIFGSSIEGQVTQFTFDTPYQQVWAAAKRAGKSFANIGKRSIEVHEASGTISHRTLDQTRDRSWPRGSREPQLMASTWKDEFRTEVIQITAQQTKVRVARKVVELRNTSRGMQWANAISNEKIERWLLSRIEDEIKSPSETTPVEEQAKDDGKGPILRNSDVINLLNAKVSENVIMAKIRRSQCRFDVSTEAIIELKQAGASDRLIQFIIEGDAVPNRPFR